MRIVEVDFTNIELCNPEVISKLERKLEHLPLKKRAYIRNRFAGLSAKEAAAEAQISAQTGRKLDKDPTIQEMYQELVRKTIPMEEIVMLIKGGAHAQIPGTENPDWKVRKPYVEMAATHSGYYEPKAQETKNAALINVTVQHIGSDDRHTIEATTQTEFAAE